MTVIIAVANQKGGVGKTTTVVNLASFCSLAGKRVLVVDNDPQGNATSVLAPDYQGPSIYAGGHPLATVHDDLAIIPAGEDLPSQQQNLVMRQDGNSALALRLQPIAAEYDLVFIDCPPSLAVLPLNALVAADAVLIPIQCEYYAMEGLGQILDALRELNERGLAQPGLTGFLLTMYDDQLPFAHAVAQEIEDHFDGQVFTTRIPRDVALAAAPSHNRSILSHDPLSPGGLAYLAATKELLHGLE